MWWFLGILVTSGGLVSADESLSTSTAPNVTAQVTKSPTAFPTVTLPPSLGQVASGKGAQIDMLPNSASKVTSSTTKPSNSWGEQFDGSFDKRNHAGVGSGFSSAETGEKMIEEFEGTEVSGSESGNRMNAFSEGITKTLRHPRFMVSVIFGGIGLLACCTLCAAYYVLRLHPSILEDSRPQHLINPNPVAESRSSARTVMYPQYRPPPGDGSEDIELQAALTASLEQQDVSSRWTASGQNARPTAQQGQSTARAGEQASDEYQQLLTPRHL